MPIHKVDGGYKWGTHGHVYPTRAGAEKQAEAAYAHGYTGDDDDNAEAIKLLGGLGEDERRIAFDRGTVRRYDEDGRLHVELTNISKANVCPYYGAEIPGSEQIGLDADRIYLLLRDPEELRKAAPTFNNLPLLNVHLPHSAQDPQKDNIIGATGTDAVFKKPYLKNSLVVWDVTAIGGIENNSQREISCGYYYVPDMTPGTYEGERYDGVMRQIRGNHVALVAAGRAGPDVLVGDSQPEEEQSMSKKPLSRKALLLKGALAVHLKPLLATDAKINLDALLAPLAADNWKDTLPGVLKAVEKACTGKLAQDAALGNLADVAAVLNMDAEPGSRDRAEDEDDEDEDEKKRKERAEDEGKDDDEDEDKKKGEDEEEREKDKKAMDAAIKKAANDAETRAVARMRAIQEAEKAVMPYVGEVAAQDSAEAVYKLALDMLKVNVEGVHPSAYRAVLEAQPKPGAIPRLPAFDSKAANDFDARFPEVARIRQL